MNFTWYLEKFDTMFRISFSFWENFIQILTELQAIVVLFWSNTQAAKRHMEDHNLTDKEEVWQNAISWKVTLIAFLDYCGMLYQHYVSVKLMVNRPKLLLRATEVAETHHLKWADIKNMWILHADNVQRNFLNKAGSTRCVLRIRGALCMNVYKRFVESDIYSLLWCANLQPNWWTRCGEWTNETSTQIRNIFSYTRCTTHYEYEPRIVWTQLKKNLQPWNSCIANNDKKLNVSKPCVTTRKKPLESFAKFSVNFSRCHKFW